MSSAASWLLQQLLLSLVSMLTLAVYGYLVPIQNIGSRCLIFGKLVTVHSVARFAVEHCGYHQSFLFGSDQ